MLNNAIHSLWHHGNPSAILRNLGRDKTVLAEKLYCCNDLSVYTMRSVENDKL